MLAADEKRLRWCGMDMRPRWRRRVAVVVTYVTLIWALGTVSGRWWGHPALVMLVLILLVLRLGVFRAFGLERSFEEPVARVEVNGLDEWARYRFAVASFEEAPEAQKAELRRTYHAGGLMVVARISSKALRGDGAGVGKPYLDEREVVERDSLVRWSMVWVRLVLGFFALMYAIARQPIEMRYVAMDFAIVLVLAVTLPQARLLWTECDPREESGEMELVEGEA